MTTLEDLKAKSHKDKTFEERAKGFEKEVEAISKEWGVAPGAVLRGNEVSLVATPVLRDLWASSKESATSGT